MSKIFSVGDSWVVAKLVVAKLVVAKLVVAKFVVAKLVVAKLAKPIVAKPVVINRGDHKTKNTASKKRNVANGPTPGTSE